MKNTFHVTLQFWPEGGVMCAPVSTPWYWISHDVNIFIWSWCGAQGKEPTIDLAFYVSRIKIYGDGIRASHAQCNFGHHENTQLIKIPTTSYVNATLKRWGHDFTRNREGKYSHDWANRVNPNVNGRTHKSVNYPFCHLCPIIYFFHKLVEVVNTLGSEEYGSQIWIGKAIILWEIMFLNYGESKCS